MTWPNQGIHEGVKPEDYFGLKELDGVLVRSKSMLRDFDQSPKAFRDGWSAKQTEAMKGGSLFDCLLTSPHEFDSQFIISPYDEFRTNESKAWRNDQFELGLTVIKAKEHEAALIAVESVKSDPRFVEMTLGNPRWQVAMRADIEGKPFKGLVDLVPDEDESPYGDALVDFKRCGTMADLRDVLRTCRKFAYGVQGGLYRGLWQLAGGNKRQRFILFIVPADMTEPDAEICVLELGQSLLSNGAQEAMRINRRLSECEASGIWPGKYDGVIEVDQADEAWEWSKIDEDLETTEQAAP